MAKELKHFPSLRFMQRWCKTTSPRFHFPCFQNNDAVRPSAYQNTCQVLVPEELPLPVFQGISLAPRLFTNTLVSSRWPLAVIRAVFYFLCSLTDLAHVSCRRGFVLLKGFFFASENEIFRPVLSSEHLNKRRNRLTVAFGCCFQSKVPAGASDREQSGTCQQLLVTTFLFTVGQHKPDCSSQFSVTFFDFFLWLMWK